MEDLKVGDVVIYIDTLRKVHFGLVTAVWNQAYINLVYLSDDEAKHDSYGRQIERDATSVPLFGSNPGTAAGRSFKRLPKLAQDEIAAELTWIANNVQAAPQAV